MYVGHFLERNSVLYRKKTALQCGTHSETFEELRNRSMHLSNMFMSLKLDPGDRVALLDYNSAEYIEILLAVSLSSLVGVPLNFRLSARELKMIVDDCSCKVLVYSTTFASVVEQMKNELLSVRHFLRIDDLREAASGLLPKSTGETIPAVRDEEPVLILYTSGTTGMPKGAVLTHRNMLAVLRNNIIEQGIVPEHSFIQAAPLFHVAPLQTFLAHLYQGCTCLIMRQFDLEAMMTAIQNNRITTTFLVPRMLSVIHSHPKLKDYDLSSLSTIIYGGAHTPVEQLKEFLNTWGQIMSQTYGSTETGLVAVLRKHDHAGGDGKRAGRLRSCGRQVLDVQVKITDSSGNSADCGEIGEIVVKGEGVIQEYWQKPLETSECIKDGWFHTGDLGFLDAEGYLFIVDRKKDMIISGGENIYPAEIENVLYLMPEILEAAVVGVPDKKWGATVKAIVVLKEGYHVTEKDVIDFCKRNLAGYKKPASVDFVPELPKNASGKILKRVLREKYLS
jgi:acyl-CoA synthetase (AMP-forming)/AMP-acid ligase II